MSEGSRLSSETEPLGSSAEPTPRTRGENFDRPFVLTLPHLHGLYSQTRGLLLREAQMSWPDTASAEEAIQDAFAAAAKSRFGFRSEKAAVTWLRAEISERALTQRSAPPSVPEALCDWADVLRRANISTSTPVVAVDTPQPRRSLRLSLLRNWGSRVNSEEQSRSSSA
jgi:DNA-directed RNA polymerase specialized sigma24 family protein